MGLKKEIILSNGIVTMYHRIVSLNKIVNKNNVIEIASYIDENNRTKEKESIELVLENDQKRDAGEEYDENIVPLTVFTNINSIEKEYDDNETISNAYEYLKTIPMFEGAEDIL